MLWRTDQAHRQRQLKFRKLAQHGSLWGRRNSSGRHDRNADTCLHPALERVKAADLHARTSVEAALGEKILNGFPVRAILAGEKQALIVEVGWRHLLQSGQRVRRRDKQRDGLKSENERNAQKFYIDTIP